MAPRVRACRPAAFSSATARRPLSTSPQPVDDGHAAATPAGAPASANFRPRRRFPLPTVVPSWYAGHMQRAVRSMPYLLSRSPPPLVIEARDSRLPITSINPVFEELLRKAPAADAGFHEASDGDGIGHGWGSRRLVVYTKRDLIDPRLEEPIIRAFRKHGGGQEVIFVDTRKDKHVKKVLEWVQERARHLAASPLSAAAPRSERAEKRAKATLSGAFRHTPTPEEGVRLLILGMPNVGKSSLLNALRRVGTGKGKAASTAPHPGHTRKLTGTVRISKHGPTQTSDRRGDRRSGAKHRGREGDADGDAPDAREHGGNASLFTIDPDSSALGAASTSSAGPSDAVETSKKPYDPPIYVYDTPGVMVPFLGRGRAGAERAIKLALAAGIKTSLFDVQMLADYLLYRLNLRYGYELQQRELEHASETAAAAPRPAYLTHMPLPPDGAEPTNSVADFLELVAERAPGTMTRGGTRDLDGAAEFFVQRWREGKVGDSMGELDLGIGELPPVYVDEDEVGVEGPPKRRESFDEEAETDSVHLDKATPEESIEARIDRLVAAHFLEVERDMLQRDRGRRGRHAEDSHGHSISSALVSRSGIPVRRESSAVRSRTAALEKGTSMNQAKKQLKREDHQLRMQRLRERGVALKRKSGASSLAAKAPWIGGRLQRKSSKGKRSSGR